MLRLPQPTGFRPGADETRMQPRETDNASHRLELQALMRAEIPLAAQMGVEVDRLDDDGLWLSIPLAPNVNPHQTAFAGSLNALCTLAGWGMSQELARRVGVNGSTVIRRSSIKYREPVETARIVAQCLPARPADWLHFKEMLSEKGKSKVDLVVEVAGVDPERPAVLFAGSYVVVQRDAELD